MVRPRALPYRLEGGSWRRFELFRRIPALTTTSVAVGALESRRRRVRGPWAEAVAVSARPLPWLPPHQIRSPEHRSST